MEVHVALVILVVLEAIFLFYFLYVVLYNLILSIAGLFKARVKLPSVRVINDIVVLIPAYKEDNVIVSTAKYALKQNYPTSNYDIVVIGDSLKTETIRKLKEMPIKYIQANFEVSTKVRSMKYALERLDINYNLAVILDADNLMRQDFLNIINNHFNAGYQAIQGQRKPKNNNSSLAVLDGLSEHINNHILRKGTCNLGGSSAIVGSGFAVEYGLFHRVLCEIDSIGGFDKELELMLLKRKVRVQYVADAKVLDEKVENDTVFENQRKRWISSQYFYLRKYFWSGMQALVKGDFAYFNSLILRYVQLPRLLNLGILFILALIFLIVNHESSIVPWFIWPVLFLLFLLSILLAIPIRYYNKDFIKAIIKIPGTFFIMLKLLFRLKGANKKFLHTPHNN